MTHDTEPTARIRGMEARCIRCAGGTKQHREGIADDDNSNHIRSGVLSPTSRSGQCGNCHPLAAGRVPQSLLMFCMVPCPVHRFYNT